MKWEQRWREMALAGGALAAAACANGSLASDDRGGGPRDAGSSDALSDASASPAISYVCCNASPDLCCTCDGQDASAVPASCAQKLACQADGGTWAADSIDGPCSLPQTANTNNFCCNANPDPCCGIGYCEDPDAVAYASCEQKWTACQSEGGNFLLPYANGAVWPSEAGCSLPQEAGPGDAGADGDGHD